ncbi:MAG TPA: hypothetical protein VFJ16_23195, partial [Longimicrobium sp.]|nr:hypothetical protein [Longimicrobium sp.]
MRVRTVAEYRRGAEVSGAAFPLMPQTFDRLSFNGFTALAIVIGGPAPSLGGLNRGCGEQRRRQRSVNEAAADPSGPAAGVCRA